MSEELLNHKCAKHTGMVNMTLVEFPANNCPHCKVETLTLEVERLREPLALLVALKEEKDEFGKTNHYVTLKPLAWHKAKEALKESIGVKEKE